MARWLRRLRQRVGALGFRSLSRRSRRRSSGLNRPLCVERLESRSLLAATLVGTVWHDLNSDGQQAIGEPGLQHAVAELFSSSNGTVGDADDVALGTQITDAAGNYRFTGLVAGVNHYVVIRPPVGFAFTVQDTGPDATDSDVSATTGRSAMFAPVDLSTVDLDAGLTGAAPAFGWVAQQRGSSSFDEGRSVAVDAAGNAVATGAFQGTTDFDHGPGAYNLTSGGGTDAYVAKYTAAGALVWARRVGGTAWDVGAGVAVDSGGSILVTGSFAGTVDFNPGAGTDNLTSAGGSDDAFVLKLDAAGNYVWARRVGGTGFDEGRAIAVDASGNAVISGDFEGTVDFDPGAGTANRTSAGNADIFVLKLDAAGNYLWAERFGSTNQDLGYGVAVAAAGEVVVTGYFQGTADFDPGAGLANLTSAGNQDVFVLKLDAAGAYVWARRVGGTIVDIGYGVAVDAGGNVLVAGAFQVTVDFDPGTGTANLTSAGGDDLFVLKLDAAGNYVWARRAGGPSGDLGYGVAVDAAGNVVVAGSFRETVDFDPGSAVVNLTSAGLDDAFVWKLDVTGQHVWARRAGGADLDVATGITVDSLGSVVTTGYFRATADFDPGAGTFNLTSAGSTDGFVWQFKAAAVAGTVWHDANGDGLQSAGETPIPDAVAELFLSSNAVQGDADDVALGTRITDASGNYRFTGLEPGLNYYVALRTPVGYAFTTVDAGGDDTIDSDFLNYSSLIGQSVLLAAADWTTVDLDAGLTGSAPPFGWASLVARDYYQEGTAVARDSMGNVYTVGHFYGAVDFDPGPGTFMLESAGLRDIFLTVVDSLGNLRYAVRFGSTGDDLAHDVVVDSERNIFIAGAYTYAVDFDPFTGVFELAGSQHLRGFVLKLSELGFLIWAKQLLAHDDVESRDLELDAAGNVVVTGYFRGPQGDFDPGPGTKILYNSPQIADGSSGFVLKLNSLGEYVWAHALDEAPVYGAAIDSQGNVLVTGAFSGRTDLDDGPGLTTLTSAGSNGDAFAAKFNAAGVLQWARRFGGTGADGGLGIAIDGDDNSVIIGQFQGTAGFDPGISTLNLTSAGGNDVFVVKFSSAGNVVWVGRLGGSGDDVGADVVVGPTGNLHLVGSFRGTANVDPGTGTVDLVSAGSTDAFLATLSSAGTLVWAHRLGGPLHDFASGASVDASGAVSIAGGFFDEFDADPGPGTVVFRSPYSQSAFFALWSGSGDLVQTGQFGGGGFGQGFGVAFTPTGNVVSAGLLIGVHDFDAGPGVLQVPGLGAPRNPSGSLYVQMTTAAGAVIWARLMGGSGRASAEELEVDRNGDILVLGTFSGTIDFDPGPGVTQLTSAGEDDVFVLKLDADGKLIWVRQFGGTGDDGHSAYAFDLAVDANGNVIVISNFEGTFDVDPGPGTLILNGSGNARTFLIKLDGSGVLQWAHDLPVTAQGLAVDSLGSVLIAGFFYGTVDFDPTGGVRNLTNSRPPGYAEYFLAKYATGGDIQWALETGQPVDDLAVDSANHVLMVGNFDGVLDFDPGPGKFELFGSYDDLFVTKLTSSGEFVWARTTSGGAGTISGERNLAVDQADNVVVVSAFEDSADFDPGSGVRYLYPTNHVQNRTDIVIWKLSSGGSLQRAAKIGGREDEVDQDVAIHVDGTVAVTGWMNEAGDYDPSPDRTFTLLGHRRAGFVAVFRPEEFQPEASVVGNGQTIAAGDPTPSPADHTDFGAATLSGGTVTRIFTLTNLGQVALALTGTPRVAIGGPHAADFTVSLQPPNGTLGANQSTTFQITFDPSAVGLRSAVVTIASDDLDEGAYSFAIQGTGNLSVDVSGTVWHDANSDGLQTAGEAGMQFAVAELYQSTNGTIGDADDMSLGSRITDAAGRYRFNGFYAGMNLYVVVRPPVGHGYTTANVVGDEALDSDVTSPLGRSAMFTPAGDDAFDVDAGLVGALPGFGWAQTVGSTGDDVSRATALDAAGNLYVTGEFYGTVDVDHGYTITSAGSGDVFVAKYTPTGALQWARRIGGAALDSGQGVAVDRQGNVVVTGYFSGTVDFDPGAGTLNLTSAGSWDAFVAKFDPEGNILWAKGFGGEFDDRGLGVAVKGDGTIAFTGYFQVLADFDPGPGTFNLTGSWGNEAFVAVLTNSGNLVWAGAFSGATGDEVGTGVAFEPTDGVFAWLTVTGTFRGTVDFDPGTGTQNLTSAGGSDLFIAEFFVGFLGVSFNWARRIGGTGDDAAAAVTTDRGGNTVVSGSFQGTVDFDPGAGVANLTSAATSDAFVVNLNGVGEYVWAKRLGRLGSANAVAVDAAGNTWLAGSFQGTADFDPGPGVVNLTSAGSGDAFVLQLDAAGELAWARRLGGTSGDAVRGLKIDAAGNVIVAGDFRGAVDFDLGVGTYTLGSGTSATAFVARYNAAQFVPAMGLTGNGQAIASEDETPSAADHTDFGLVAVDGGTLTRTFTIQNAGVGILRLTGLPVVVVDGEHAADFGVRLQPGERLDTGQSATFEIVFDPSAAGLRTAIVTIEGNDPDDDRYSFWIQGTGAESATVSGTVWHDANGDGQQTAGEAGTPHAVVELFRSENATLGDADDVSVGTQTTNLLGGYLFTGLAAGVNHYVAVRPPVGFAFTAQDTGPDATDSDVSATGMSAMFVPADLATVDLDAGLTGGAPVFGWAARQGDAGIDAGQAVAIGDDGAAIVVGRFQGTVDLDPGPGTVNLTSAGSDDAFVARYSAGGALIWARRVGGASADVAYAVAVDAAGELLVSGSFQGTADFDPGAGIANMTSAGSDDLFVLRLDAAGNFLWARGFGAANSDAGSSVTVDSTGSVVVTGSFEGTVDFDPSEAVANLTSAGLADVFVLKLDVGGYYLWARRVGGTDIDRGMSAAYADAVGNVVVAGYFGGTVDFDPGAGTQNLTSAGGSDGFVVKFISEGNYVWARRVGGTGFDRASDLAVDGGGNVVVAGYFGGTVDFDPGAGTQNLTSAGSDDAFVLKLDAAGNYVWARQVGGTSFDGGNGLAVDASGNVFVRGYFGGTVDFDPGPGTRNLTASGLEVFVVKLDTGGNFVEALQVAASQADVGQGIAVDAAGNVVVTGRLFVTADFDPGAGAFALTSAGGDDSFLWRLSATNFLPPIVTGVFVRGTGDASGTGNDEWQAVYLGHLGTQGLGDAALGYRVSVGADQLDTLPWTNVDTISIRFSEGVTVTSGNLQVLGAAEGPPVPSVARFSYNASTFTATWQFSTALPANKYLLHFATGAVVGLDTFALDGEWTDGVSTNSGNGAAGGAFAFRVNVVPGDTNGDTFLTQSVTNADVLLTKQRFGTDTSDGASYAYRRDVNGSGAITNADVLSVKQRLQTSIADFTDPLPPPPGESSGEESFAAGTLLDESAVAPTARLAEPWHSEPSGPIDLAAWDAAILAIYGKKK